MKNFYYWIIDRLFDEKINNAICAIVLTLSVCFIAFQILRHFFRIHLIAQL